MITEKKVFKMNEFHFQTGQILPIQMGYETYGTLNEKKDNAILVVHYFSANSHAAGKYNEEDTVVGFWDGLIGPGKAVDTNKYFVICSDNICNCGAKNPNVITTGPMTSNPKTNKPYALDFPVPQVLDIVNSQKSLLDHLGVTHLKAIIGPSFGAMSSWQWAVAYPDMMDKIIPVIGSPRHPVYGAFAPLQHGIRVAQLDPKWNGGNYYEQEAQPIESLELAMQMMNVAAFHAGYYERTYQRNTPEDKDCLNDILSWTSFEKKLYETVMLSVPYTDLNHWIYTCRMCINYDISRPFNGDMDQALSKIKAKVLAIPCKQDALHPAEFVAYIVHRINALGGDAQIHILDSDYGHMAGILQTDLFSEKVRSFLNE